jgi:DNA processing protein
VPDVYEADEGSRHTGGRSVLTEMPSDEARTLARSDILLRLLSLPGMDEVRLSRLMDTLAATGTRLEEFGAYTSSHLVSRFGFTVEEASRFLTATLDSVQVARWSPRDGDSLLTRADPAWPANLLKDHARQATPWLFLQGDPGILSQPAIGIAGSRDATERSLRITKQLAANLVQAGRVTVSGGANGIDSAAHDAALAAGGCTIVVLAQGIGTFRPSRKWQEAIDDGRMLVVSEYLPTDVWDAPRAIRRNATIVQLSEALVVIQANAPSGTLSAGQSAIRMKWPLHVVRQIGDQVEAFQGNDVLIRRGGTPIDVAEDLSIPRQVFEQLLAPLASAQSLPTQLGLFS